MPAGADVRRRGRGRARGAAGLVRPPRLRRVAAGAVQPGLDRPRHGRAGRRARPRAVRGDRPVRRWAVRAGVRCGPGRPGAPGRSDFRAGSVPRRAGVAGHARRQRPGGGRAAARWGGRSPPVRSRLRAVPAAGPRHR